MVLREMVFGPGWWKLAIPSILFVSARFSGRSQLANSSLLLQVFQANAQYLASGNLSVPTFQLAYQLKVNSTTPPSPF